MIDKVRIITVQTESGAKQVTVTITTRLNPKPYLDLNATCENARAHRRSARHANHALTAEQFQKDLAHSVRMVAEECAGHARSHELLKQIGDPAPAAANEGKERPAIAVAQEAKPDAAKN